MEMSKGTQEEKQESLDHIFRETIELERKRKQLERALAEFEEQQKKFEREKREYQRKMEAKERLMEQQDRLFDMKWKLLEKELKEVAKERQQIERQKEFYARVSEFEKQTYGMGDSGCQILFTGVDSEQGLKRRYKDLLKIFHPDNPDGDNNLVQEINKEYNQLKKTYHH